MSHWKFISGIDTEFYYLTATVIDWTYVFTSPEYFQIIIESLKYCQRHKELRLAGYVIMPNHLHLICAGTATNKLSNTMRDFKQFTARNIINCLRAGCRWKEIAVFERAAASEGKGNDHKFWLEGNHPILVDTEQMFSEKLNYLHDNPVRKGFVESPEHWLYSSARNYMLGDHSIIEVECVE